MRKRPQLFKPKVITKTVKELMDQEDDVDKYVSMETRLNNYPKELSNKLYEIQD